MSRAEAYEIRHSVVRALHSILGQKLEKAHEQSIYNVGEMTFYLKSTIGSNPRKYLFGISYESFLRDVYGMYDILNSSRRTKGYLLLLRGYKGGIPEKMYLIPATFFDKFWGNDFSMEKATGIFKLTLIIDSDGKEWIDKDSYERDLRQYWVSVEDIVRVLLPDYTSEKPEKAIKGILRTDNDLARTYGINLGRDLIRDSAKARELKNIYGYRCQLCGGIHIGNGQYYTEVHHIWPLGHGGPDDHSNMVVVCPNHHAEFEYGCLTIVADGDKLTLLHIDADNEFGETTMHLKSGHNIALESLHYHEDNIWQRRVRTNDARQS